MDVTVPDLAAIEATHAAIRPHIVETPILECAGIEDELDGSTVVAKLEFLQRTGTFKARGALSVILGLDDEERVAGVTAVSAGNHAIAVAFAARMAGTSARVVMIRNANPLRIERCREFGAEVVLADDVHAAFEMAEAISREEGRFFVHPFEGEAIARGTATLGLEFCRQAGHFDVLLVPIGGGGLCAGVSTAVRLLNPDCRIVGIEPTGADTMYRSLASGRPESIDKVTTIADSLGAPFAMPYSFELCRRNVDEVVRVSDEAMSAAMRFLFRRMKIVVESACASTTAAMLGELKDSLAGKRIAVVMCGSNIDWATWSAHAGLP